MHFAPLKVECCPSSREHSWPCRVGSEVCAQHPPPTPSPLLLPWSHPLPRSGSSTPKAQRAYFCVPKTIPTEVLAARLKGSCSPGVLGSRKTLWIFQNVSTAEFLAQSKHQGEKLGKRSPKSYNWSGPAWLPRGHWVGVTDLVGSGGVQVSGWSWGGSGCPRNSRSESRPWHLQENQPHHSPCVGKWPHPYHTHTHTHTSSPAWPFHCLPKCGWPLGPNLLTVPLTSFMCQAAHQLLHLTPVCSGLLPSDHPEQTAL